MCFTKPSVYRDALDSHGSECGGVEVLLSVSQMGRRRLNQTNSTIPAVSERAGGEHAGEGSSAMSESELLGRRYPPGGYFTLSADT